MPESIHFKKPVTVYLLVFKLKYFLHELMRMTKQVFELIDQGIHPKRLAIYLLIIFITTIIGTMFIEALSDYFLPGIKFSGMHILTIFSSGIIATTMAFLFLNKFETLFEKIYHENEERKRAEAELEASRAEAELYVDLMSHDINNMNQVAMGYTEMAIGKLNSGETLDKKNFDLLSRTMDMLNNSSNLIDNVGKIRKARSHDMTFEEVDIADVIAELHSKYYRSHNKGVAINYKIGRDCIVRANGLIGEIFYNLIGNAIKHSSRDNVKVNVDVKRIDLGGNDYCLVCVDDNGPGISDDLKKKIFRRFERGKTKATGKGLGLYLVKTLVERFKGDVWVEDRIPGDHRQGSMFVVLLPAAAR